MVGYPDEEDEDIDSVKNAITSPYCRIWIPYLLEIFTFYYINNFTQLIDNVNLITINILFPLLALLATLLHVIILLVVELGSFFIKEHKHRSVFPILLNYSLTAVYVVSLLIVIITGTR